ncbi:hypothetical protein BOTCAL_0083g00170 [Botryotinia calthae]|uniref:Uncharacterized protein n=1 Tax=Botryotinia calthae TaxID=38488 RepID=A0A4Y8DA23_9HELO|nr:hypothetical protein BOTCAL_0083g00170 [Botryotinia calthae]
MTNYNGVYEPVINLRIDQYTLNGNIRVGRQGDLAPDLDGTQSRSRPLNPLDTVFQKDGKRISDVTIQTLKLITRAINQDQGFRDGTDLINAQNILSFKSTKDDDCEFEIVSSEETFRLWGMLPGNRGGDIVSSQVQTALPLRNERQTIILSDINCSNYHTSNGTLRENRYETWDGTVFNDRMAGLSGSNQEKILRSGLLATETSTGMEQLSSQYGMPDLDDQIPESIRPPQFLQFHDQFTDYPQSDGDWTSASHRTIPNDYLNTDRSAEQSMNSPQQPTKYFNANSGGYGSGSQNEIHGNQVPVPRKRSQGSHQQENHSPIPRKRARTRGAMITEVQVDSMNVTGDQLDLEGVFELDEINRSSHNPTKRNKLVKTNRVYQPRVEQRAYCMSRVSVSLEEMKVIDPDYDEHPLKTFLPERMKFSRQTGMKTIVMPTRMINLLNTYRQKAREEERKNPTGRKIPRDFNVRPKKHKDFEAFQVARKMEEETQSYDNRTRIFANSRSTKLVR